MTYELNRIVDIKAFVGPLDSPIFEELIAHEVRRFTEPGYERNIMYADGSVARAMKIDKENEQRFQKGLENL